LSKDVKIIIKERHYGKWGGKRGVEREGWERKNLGCWRFWGKVKRLGKACQLRGNHA
jgi:hypothetical protein